MPLVTVAIRLAADGVKPAVVERWTRYSVTPTLSVAAAQPSATELADWRAAVSDAGLVGACVSGARSPIAWLEGELVLPAPSAAITR